MLLYFLNQTSCCWSQTWSCQTLNMELPFWKHITWYSEFSTLCKNYVTLVKIWNAIFSWCLPFTKLKCFIEENSMNIGKIPSLSSQDILSDICKCLWRNWQYFNICTIEISQMSQIFLERRPAITQITRTIFIAFNVSICFFLNNIVNRDESIILFPYSNGCSRHVAFTDLVLLNTLGINTLWLIYIFLNDDDILTVYVYTQNFCFFWIFWGWSLYAKILVLAQTYFRGQGSRKKEKLKRNCCHQARMLVTEIVFFFFFFEFILTVCLNISYAGILILQI